VNPAGGEVLLRVEGLHKQYARRRGLLGVLRGAKRDEIRAVDNLGFEVYQGEVVGLAGESGSGKSVTAELVAALQAPTRGRVIFEGKDIARHTKRERREFRRRVSMVFQDPYDALNPRMQVRDSVGEPLQIHRIGTDRERKLAVLEVLERVGLRPPARYANAYPHQLSGGERQRAAVARALITRPKLLIADEPTTMLDVSVRTGLLNLLKDMTRGEELAMLFISHDFTTLSYLCDRIVIIYLGRVAEVGPARDVLTEGLHPYTQVLSAAIPVPDPEFGRERVRGSLDTSDPSPAGCLFAPRCPYRMDRCTRQIPHLMPQANDRSVACYLYDPLNDRDPDSGHGTNRLQSVAAPRARRGTRVADRGGSAQ
jgi:oligopeptide/dipeptide ABC transporter ATP-binding protein